MFKGARDSRALLLHRLDILQCRLHLLGQKFVLLLFQHQFVCFQACGFTFSFYGTLFPHSPSSLSTSFCSFWTDRSANSARVSASLRRRVSARICSS